jgi:hypothetical protein
MKQKRERERERVRNVMTIMNHTKFCTDIDTRTNIFSLLMRMTLRYLTAIESERVREEINI